MAGRTVQDFLIISLPHPILVSISCHLVQVFKYSCLRRDTRWPWAVSKTALCLPWFSFSIALQLETLYRAPRAVAESMVHASLASLATTALAGKILPAKRARLVIGVQGTPIGSLAAKENSKTHRGNRRAGIVP